MVVRTCRSHRTVRLHEVSSYVLFGQKGAAELLGGVDTDDDNNDEDTARRITVSNRPTPIFKFGMHVLFRGLGR